MNVYLLHPRLSGPKKWKFLASQRAGLRILPELWGVEEARAISKLKSIFAAAKRDELAALQAQRGV